MSTERPTQERGAIAYMARNGVAANLLMFFMFAAGIAALGGLVQEVFPEFSLDQIQVSVPYPGATPVFPPRSGRRRRGLFPAPG